MKYLLGILPLSCVVASALLFFLAREPMFAMVMALLGVVSSEMTTSRRRPGRHSTSGASRREGYAMRQQRRRLLADLKAHQAAMERGDGDTPSAVVLGKFGTPAADQGRCAPLDSASRDAGSQDEGPGESRP